MQRSASLGLAAFSEQTVSLARKVPLAKSAFSVETVSSVLTVFSTSHVALAPRVSLVTEPKSKVTPGLTTGVFLKLNALSVQIVLLPSFRPLTLVAHLALAASLDLVVTSTQAASSGMEPCFLGSMFSERTANLDLDAGLAAFARSRIGASLAAFAHSMDRLFSGRVAFWRKSTRLCRLVLFLRL